jgi:hypothetical protein
MRDNIADINLQKYITILNLSTRGKVVFFSPLNVLVKELFPRPGAESDFVVAKGNEPRFARFHRHRKRCSTTVVGQEN